MRLSPILLALCVVCVSTAAQAAAPARTAPVATGAPHDCTSYYPPAAAKAYAAGDSEVAFRVGVDGVPREPKLSRTSGNVDLDEAALACVVGWRYQPATQDGKAVEVPWKVSVRWRMRETPVQPLGAHECDDVMHTAAAQRLNGVTRVKMQIDTDGIPRDVSVENSSGDAEVDKLAVACVVEWKYRPATKDGQPVSVPWETEVDWNAPGDVGAPVATSFIPDVVHLEPRIHRLGIDTQMYAAVSATLKLAPNGQTWRCRQVFFDVSGEHHVRHWIAQGWGDSDDFLYARTENGRYVAVHIKSDGTFIAALEMDDATGIGKGLDYPAVADFVKEEVGAWNASVAEK